VLLGVFAQDQVEGLDHCRGGSAVLLTRGLG
jgi:hypothetical protein